MAKNKERTKEEWEDLVHELGYNLTYPQIEALIFIYNQTETTRNFENCLPKHKKYMADLVEFGLVEGQNEPYTVDVFLKDDKYKYSKFRITAEGTSLARSIIRKTKQEMEQSSRETLVIRANKQGPVRPFLALIVSALSLIVSIIALYRSFL